MLTLKEIGESFTDTHPIMNLLGDGRILSFLAIAIFAIVIITTIITSMTTSNNSKKIKGLFRVSATVTILILIVLITGIFSYLEIDSTPQHLTYEGKSKVVNVSPIKKGGVQDVTLEHKGQTYQVSQPTKVAQHINKGDKVQLECHIKHYLKSHAKCNDYQNKDGSFKKEIQLQDHMDELKLKPMT